MNRRLSKIAIWVGYPFFYLICFVLSAYFTFPFEHLKDRILLEFANDQRATGGNMRLEIDRLTSYWLTGIEAQGVRLVGSPSAASDGTARPPSEIDLEMVTVRAAMLPLLIGRVTINVQTKGLGGALSASTHQRGHDRMIQAELDRIAIDRIGLLADLVGLPLQGDLKGKIDLALPDGKVQKASGTVNLVLANASVSDGKTKIKDTIVLPKMNIGDVALDCELKDGVARVTKFAGAGQDLDFSSDGKLTLRDPFSESQADLYVKFKFADAYKNRNDTTRGLFGAPGSSAPPLIEVAEPRMKTAKRVDGFYSWHVWGLLRTIRYDPAPVGAAVPSVGNPSVHSFRGFVQP